MIKRILAEIDSFFDRDPAAYSRIQVVLCYPGFHALMAYRLSHWLWEKKWKLLARFISQLARWFSGIEIHPGAKIGERLFIDHGMGVVIGETATIGNDVTIYHDVTLGGVSPHKDKPDSLRHPQVGNHVIIGSGAQLLGPITVGDHARVGSNAVVVKDVPEHATMVGIPARNVADKVKKGQSVEEDAFEAYGVIHGDLPDPVMRAMEQMSRQVEKLQKRIAELEKK